VLIKLLKKMLAAQLYQTDVKRIIMNVDKKIIITQGHTENTRRKQIEDTEKCFLPFACRLNPTLSPPGDRLS
jgi:hypothetical protein